MIERLDGTVYLLCFDKPYRHCQHYLGWAAKDRLLGRIQCHKQGNGSRLTKAFHKQGIGFRVVRLWQGNRLLERRLRDYKNNVRLCPFCSTKVQPVMKIRQRCKLTQRGCDDE